MARAIPFGALTWETQINTVNYLSEHLREADKAELRAIGIEDFEEALRFSVSSSPLVYVILDTSGLPIGIFGAAPGLSPFVGDVWMVGTDGLLKERLSVARQTKRYVEELNDLFPILRNHVDARNELSMHWLEWAGFDIIDAVELGSERHLFYEFARTPT